MKRILLPTDFSENSLNAIRYAMTFFKNSEMDFFVLNVQKTSDYTTADLMSRSSGSTVYRAILEDNKKALNKFIAKLKKLCVGEKYTFHPLVDYDVFTDAIQQAITTNKIDLIIMGTNGATGAKEVLFGSNTLNVIRQVESPLITVPEGYLFKKIKTVLLSVNYQDISSSNRLLLNSILKRTKATLKILDIKEKSIQVSNDLSKEQFNTQIPSEYYSLVGIPVPIAINAFEQLFPIELHAMVVERKSFLDRFIFGSETSEISYNSPVPMLLMHP